MTNPNQNAAAGWYGEAEMSKSEALTDIMAESDEQHRSDILDGLLRRSICSFCQRQVSHLHFSEQMPFLTNPNQYDAAGGSGEAEMSKSEGLTDIMAESDEQQRSDILDGLLRRSICSCCQKHVSP